MPPENKPLPDEITTCRRFLDGDDCAPCPISSRILALGRIAHDSVVRTLGRKLPPIPSRMAADIAHCCGPAALPSSTAIIARATTRTPGCLTTEMFTALFGEVRAYLDATPPAPA